jgi:hypothetical protein
MQSHGLLRPKFVNCEQSNVFGIEVAEGVAQEISWMSMDTSQVVVTRNSMQALT